MDDKESIEYQEVMDALNGSKTFIPGTYIFQNWRDRNGKFLVRYKVTSRTPSEVTFVQVAASDGYRFIEKYAGPMTLSVTRSPFDGNEICMDRGLQAKDRCLG